MRIRTLNRAPLPGGAEYVLYWAQMNRRAESNQALEHAVWLANEHNLPVLFYEGLTCSYPCASDRFHTFLLEGVAQTSRRLKARGIAYLFHLRRRPTDPDDALYRLAQRALTVVTDDYPTFVAARHNASVSAKIGVPYVAVDASCIVPMAYFGRREYAAYTIRPKIHKVLGEHLKPVETARLKRRFEGPLPCAALHTEVADANVAALVAACEIDHTVAPSRDIRGGRAHAETRLETFLEHNLRRYAKYSSKPSERATSELSAYLHFGAISSLEVALAASQAAEEHQWMPQDFLEQLIVRRELAFNFARYTDRLESLDGLPDWARATLARHDGDPREYVYTPEQFERAETHDPLWNAAQTELLTRGVIHGYYRMYWGKKIIEWSASHGEALRIMIHLHDRYALDGRDPNTITNILWCFGLHDRPWKERPVFGMIRYMSYEGMRRKTDADAYIQQVMPRQGTLLL